MSNVTGKPELGANIAALREKKNLSLAELAERSGVSESMLVQIEQEKVNPTVATVWKLAKGLGVNFHGILGGRPGKERLFEVLRRDDSAMLMAEDGSYTIRITSPIQLKDTLEIYHLFFKPGGVLESAPHYPGTEEFLTVVKGSLKVRSAGETDVLHSGDSVRYQADVKHSIANTATEEAEAFLVVQFKKE